MISKLVGGVVGWVSSVVMLACAAVLLGVAAKAVYIGARFGWGLL